MNPWKIDSEGWSFEARDMALLGPSNRRKRAFTGQLNASRSSMPAHMHIKSRVVKMGIAIFIAADLFLAFVFLSSVL